MEYYILYNGQQVGPMTKRQLLSYGLNPNSMIWTPGMMKWEPAYTQPDLMDLIKEEQDRKSATGTFSQMASNVASGVNSFTTPHGEKNRVVYCLLAIFLGYLGIHYFYTGKIAGGFICILLCLCSCGLWTVITFIQGIYALTLPQPVFQSNFVNTSRIFPIF